jgi:hypothetical protein
VRFGFALPQIGSIAGPEALVRVASAPKIWVIGGKRGREKGISPIVGMI